MADSDLNHDITRLLQLMDAGDQDAPMQLIELVYKNLHAAARFFLNRSVKNPSLTPTTLVHEFFIKLTETQKLGFESRAEFFNFSRNIMRGFISDYCKRNQAQKRGHGQRRLAMEQIEANLVRTNADQPLLHEALTELHQRYPLSSAIVEYRFFFGLTYDQIAELLDRSRSTVRREWEFARAFIFQHITSHDK